MYKKIIYLISWLGIFILLFVSYSYRDILTNNRVFAQLMPGSAVKNDRSLIFYVAEDNHFYVIAKINHRKIKFLLDTGATNIVLTASDAQKAGIDTNNLNYNRLYQTANGQVRAASVQVKNFIVGDREFNDINISITKSNMGVSLLGISFLNLFSKYQFDKHKVILFF